MTPPPQVQRTPTVHGAPEPDDPYYAMDLDAASNASTLASELSSTVTASPFRGRPGAGRRAERNLEALQDAVGRARGAVERAHHKADQLARDDTSQPRGLQRQWQDNRQRFTSEVAAAYREADQAADALKATLYDTAIPDPPGGADEQLARDEIAAALEVTDNPLDVLEDYATRGGAHAAVASSDWARHKLAATGHALADSHGQVKAQAIIHAADDDNAPAKVRQAAKAFLAFNDTAGQALTELQLARHHLSRQLDRGWDANAERHRDRTDARSRLGTDG